MTGASMEMLEEYDTKTQEILDRMKKDRDIIREETANLEKLAKQMETPLVAKGRERSKAGGKGLKQLLGAPRSRVDVWVRRSQ
ncbi:MAG: hypothetical protein ACPIOQ_79635 [Promethearchaeia archaeon]